jgi:hypothetical protein
VVVAEVDLVVVLEQMEDPEAVAEDKVLAVVQEIHLLYLHHKEIQVETVKMPVVMPMVVAEAVVQEKQEKMVDHQVPLLEEMDHLYLRLWEVLMEPQVQHQEDILVAVVVELNTEMNQTQLYLQAQVVLVVEVKVVLYQVQME